MGLCYGVVLWRSAPFYRRSIEWGACTGAWGGRTSIESKPHPTCAPVCVSIDSTTPLHAHAYGPYPIP